MKCELHVCRSAHFFPLVGKARMHVILRMRAFMHFREKLADCRPGTKFCVGPPIHTPTCYLYDTLMIKNSLDSPGRKKYAHNSHAGTSTSGTEIARNLHVLRMRTCMPFPPKIVEKTCGCAPRISWNLGNPKARSVIKLFQYFWYYFEVLFCGGSRNSTSKGPLWQKQKSAWVLFLVEVLTRCSHMWSYAHG
jgi:hypothetical protein